jgi:hypothetical protein
MRRIAGALALLMGLALGVPAASGSDATVPDGPPVTFLDGAVKVSIDPADRVEWTPERMARAKPVEFRPEVSDRKARPSVTTIEDLLAGPTPVVVPGKAPAPPTTLDRYLDASAGMVPYDSYVVEDPSDYSVAMHGKLYMLVDDDPYSEAVCSATVMPSATKMVVLTAGHCLKAPENGLWILDGAFVPGYLGNDQNPYAFWPLENMYVTQQWYESTQIPDDDYPPDSRYDVAAFTVQQYPYYGYPLGDVVGWRGIAFNLPQGQSYQSFGYPAAGKWDGEKMISCVSAPAVIDPSADGPPFTNGMGCDMTGGSSGGGWTIEDEAGDKYLNSVVSYGKGQYPEMQFGPYFGQVALELFEEVSGLDYPDVDEPDLETTGTSITFKLRKHLVASGRVSSADASCAVNAPVVIGKLKGNQATAVGQALTDGGGSFKVKVKDKPGKYVAIALDNYRDSFNLCSGSASSALKHGH